MAVLEKIYISETAVFRDRGMMACPSPVLLILNLELLSNAMRGSRTCGIGAGFMILECNFISSYSPEEPMLHSKKEKKRLLFISTRRQKLIRSTECATFWLRKDGPNHRTGN